MEDEDDARKEAEIQRLIAENTMDGEKMDKVIEELAKMENKGIGNALLKELQKKRAQIQVGVFCRLYWMRPRISI